MKWIKGIPPETIRETLPEISNPAIVFNTMAWIPIIYAQILALGIGYIGALLPYYIRISEYQRARALIVLLTLAIVSWFRAMSSINPY